tara:strand:- start:420 stop:686 length:267 start_codon:yes stop_codon:yes gene_type:complete
MKLVNISKKGTLKFELSDGRFITSYNSGYVRINGNDRLYQINKVKRIKRKAWLLQCDYKRILIHCPQQRYEYIKAWVNRNVTNKIQQK